MIALIPSPPEALTKVIDWLSRFVAVVCGYLGAKERHDDEEFLDGASINVFMFLFWWELLDKGLRYLDFVKRRNSVQRNHTGIV